jgi:CelD/BcsL family acetyltransferase involved in cellulose biosynthesis
MMESENVIISLYENSVPPFVESELEQLYENLYSSLVQLRTYGAIAGNISTYVVQKNGTTITLLLFRLDNNKVQVLNESIQIDADEINRFTHYIFSTIPSVTVISFHAIRMTAQPLAFPCQQFSVLEDIVVTLPSTSQEYLARLGKATRKNIKHHISRLKRRFPSLGHDVYLKEDVSEQHVRDIIEMNKARMVRKNKVSSFDANETERIIKLAKSCGLVSVITIDGRVCAGAICCRIGENYFSQVNAHDPEYDSYRLGTLCCYWTICKCIDYGGKEFHLLWGQYEYKYMLLGVQRDLADLAIYRSRMHLLLNGDTALRLVLNGYIRKAMLWLKDKARRRDHVSLTSHLAFYSLEYLRRLKHVAMGMATRQK